MNRFSRDILGQSGVRWVIISEGVNDIGAGVSAASLTGAYDTLIAQARAQGLRVYGGTISPFGSNSYYSVAHESVRQSVNTYIRSGKFDAFIDFDAAVRDTSNPPRLQAAYDSGVGLLPESRRLSEDGRHREPGVVRAITGAPARTFYLAG